MMKYGGHGRVQSIDIPALASEYHPLGPLLFIE